MQDDYDDDVPMEADYGSTTVWSDDDRANFDRLLAKHNGDVDNFLSDLFGRQLQL